MNSINSHHGRITGTAGDSVLAEFASVVEAVDCAVKIQDALAAANEDLPDEHRLRFRIGINVGDVMVKDGDIFGDGVNIAARLEILAEAGRHLHLARRARPCAQDGPLRLRGSGRAERQEHRTADPRLSRARLVPTAPPVRRRARPSRKADRRARTGPHRRTQRRLPRLPPKKPNSSWLSGSRSRTARMPRSLRLTSRNIPTAPSPPWPRRAAARFWRRRGRRTRSPKLTRSSSLTGTR